MYVSAKICGHEIWKSLDRWRRLIEVMLDRKAKEVRDLAQRQLARKQEAEKTAENDKVVVVKWFNKAQSWFTSQFSRENSPQNEAGEKMLAFAVAEVLQQFIQYLVHCGVAVFDAKRLVASYALKYKVSKMTRLDLQLGLQAGLPLGVWERDSGKKRAERVTERRKRKLEKFSGNLLSLALAGAADFVGDLAALRNLLILSKKTYAQIRVQVLRHVLYRFGEKLALPVRLSIWLQILDMVRPTFRDHE